MKSVLTLVALLFFIVSAGVGALPVNCSSYIRLKSYTTAGTIFVQVCSAGASHYLSFRIKKSNSISTVRYEVTTDEMRALCAGPVSDISISADSCHYTIHLDSEDGRRLQHLCSKQMATRPTTPH